MWRDVRIALLACLMALTGCASMDRTQRYLALGDSYTIGEGVAAGDRWPMQLAALLRADGLPVDDPRIVARTGWTVAELDAAMDGEALEPSYDLVTLLIGVNDQYRRGAPEEYRSQLRAMLARALRLADAQPRRVLLVSIPDWGVTAFAQKDARGAVAIGTGIDAFNQVAREEARRFAIVFVDITELSRSPAHRAELVDDGLHPSGAQYRAWAMRIAPAARTALESKGSDPIIRR